MAESPSIPYFLSPIWHVKAATAREVRQRIRAVLEWAIALDMAGMATKGHVSPGPAVPAGGGGPRRGAGAQ